MLEKCQPQHHKGSNGVWMFVFVADWGKIESMKSADSSKKTREGKLAQSPTSIENTESITLLEQDFALWLDAIREAMGGKISHLANALSKDWPDRDYNRRKVGLPSSETFLQIVRTWFQKRRTLPNDSLRNERYNRLGVLETLQSLIDSRLKEVPAGTNTGFTFSEIVERLKDARGRNSSRNKDSGSVDSELLAMGVVSIRPVKISSVREQDLLLGSSEYDGEVPPYCPRDSDAQILEKINLEACNPVVIVGPPKSGKTRSLIQNLKISKFADAKIYWLEPGFRNAKKLLERTKASEKTNVLVLDDLQNPRYFGEGGLDLRLIEELASTFKIVGTLHDYTKSQWELANVDHRTFVSDTTTNSPNSNVQSKLLENHIALSSELSDQEFEKVSLTLGIDESEVSSYRFLGSKLASVSALEKILDLELNGTNSYSHALFQALIDAKILFPQGASLEDLKTLSRQSLEMASNTPWTDSGWEIAVATFTRGLSPKSPHAIMMRTIADRSKFTLFDPIWDRKRPASWEPQHLLAMDLNFVEVAENAFELGFREATFQILRSLDISQPEIQFQIGRFYFEAENPDLSKEWLQKAAQSNHDKALDWLGDLHKEFLNDSLKALEYWKQAAALGNEWAMDSLGDYYRDNNQLIEAQEWWTKASMQDNDWATASLGNLYVDEGRVEEGLTLLKNSANRGNVWAMRQLGLFFDRQEDMSLAEYWWRKSSNLGDEVSMDRLGDLYEEAGDLAQAQFWWEKGSDLGNAWSMASLGLLKKRSGLDQEGGDLLMKAAALGNSWAMRQMGILKMEEGDKVGAEFWWQKAAELDDDWSLRQMGTLKMEEGDKVGAEFWWLKAAELDDEVAIFKLGFLEMESDNYTESSYWFEKGIALHQALSYRGMGLLKWKIEGISHAEIYWIRGAELSDDVCMDNLGDLHEDQGNLLEAEKWWKKGSDEGNSWSMYSLGWLAFERDDPVLAKEWWTKGADLNHSGCMFKLGELALDMDDQATAQKWWEMSAALENDWAIFELGRLAAHEEDFEKAEEWFKKGISMNQILSVRGMGLLKWTKEDLSEAIELFTKASNLGDVVSMDNLGDLFESQDNIEHAKLWWEKAACEGNPSSMYSLGWLAFEKNELDLAKDWWSKAAELQHAASMDSLGDLAKESEDFKAAEYWWLKAASLGDEDSMISLSELYKTNKNYEDSLKWLEICGEKNNKQAMALLRDLYLEIDNRELSQLWQDRLDSIQDIN